MCDAYANAVRRRQVDGTKVRDRTHHYGRQLERTGNGTVPDACLEWTANGGCRLCCGCFPLQLVPASQKQATPTRPELGSQVNGGRSTPTMAGTGRGVSSALRAGVACRLGSWTGRPRRHLPLSTILPGGEGREWACRKSAHCANAQAIQAFRDHVRCFSLASARNCLVLHFPLCILLDVTPHSFVRRYTLSRFLDILAFASHPSILPPRAPMPRSSP